MKRTTRSMWRLGLLSLVAFNLLLRVAAAQNGPTFTTIDFPGAISTTPAMINPGGQISGDYTDPDGHSHGFLLSESFSLRLMYRALPPL
jgi:hypothetical protein